MLNNSNLIKFECVECLDDIELVTSELNPEIKEIIKENEICLDCFNKNYFKCWNCGQYHNYNDMSAEDIEINGNYEPICGDCIDSDPDIFYYCEGCGEYKYYNEYQLNEVKDIKYNNIEYYCNNCVESIDNIFYCTYHDVYEYSEERIYVYNQGNICFDAYEEAYGTCDSCGDVVDQDNLYYTEYESYCRVDVEGYLLM